MAAAGAVNPQIPRLPAGLDPADLLTRHGADGLVAALGQRRPLTDLYIDQHLGRLRLDDTPESRVWALGLVAPLVGALPSTQRARQAHRVARRLGLDPFLTLDTIRRHVAYTPTARGPLGLPTPPLQLRTHQQTLATNARKLAALRDIPAAARSADNRTRSADTGRAAQPDTGRTVD